MAQFLRRSWIQSSIIEQLKECKQELHNQLISSDIDDRFEFCQSSFKNLQNPGRAQIIRIITLPSDTEMLRMEISDTEHLVKAVVPIEVMQLFGAGRQTYLGLQGSFISIRQCTLALHGRNSPKTYGLHYIIEEMMFYGGGGVSAVGNPENVAKDPKTLTSVNELRNLIFCDYGEFKKDLQQMQLHEGWGDFKSITYKDCIIPIEQEEKLRKIDIQSPGQISIQSEDITDFQPVPISNQPKAEETHTQSELNQNVDSALALDDGLEFTDAFAKDRNMDGEDAKMEEEEIFSHDALQFELLSTQLSEPSSTQIVGNDYPLSPLFGSSFHPDEGFVDSLDGAAVSIEDFSQSLKTQDPTIEIEQIDEISSFVAVSQEKKNENPVSDSIFQEFQTQELGNSQENEASDDGLFVDYMGIEDDFATQAAPTQDQDPNEIEEINTALLKEAQKLINQSYAATQTQNLNDNLVTQATNPQEISEVKPEPMDTPTQIVTNTFMTKNPPSDVGQSHENPASQKVIDPSESIRSESSSSVPADSLGNELHTQPVEVVDNPDKDSISDSLSFTSETSCSYIFKGINVTPRGFEQDVVSDELEDLPIFSLDGEGASCLADTLIIDSNVEKLIGANSDESRILDSVEIMKAQDTTTAIRDRESNSRQASKPLSPQNNEGVELNRWAEKINLDDENLRLNNQEPPTTTKDGNGGALIQKGPGDKYSLGAQIEVPQTDLDTVNPIPFLGATIGAVPGQITGEKETQEAIKPSPPRTHVSIVSSGFSGVQTPKNRFRGVMSADSPLWTQLDHSQPSNPATPTIGSLKISPNPQTPVISQMLIASSQPTAKYLSDKPEHVQIERIPSSDNSKSNRLEQDKIQILESEYESHTADSQLSFMPVGISPIKNRAIVSDRVLQQLDKKMKPTDSSRHESSPVLLRNTVKRHIISANLLKALNESIPSSPVVKDLDTNESAIYISDAKLDIGMQENVSGQGSDDSECPLVKSTPVSITNSTRCISPSSEYQVSVNSNTSEFVKAQTQYHRDQECNIMFHMESNLPMSPKAQILHEYSPNINETSPALRDDQENRVKLDQEKCTMEYKGEQELPNYYIDENSIQAVEKTLERSQSQDIFESQANLSPQRRFIESPFQPYQNNLSQNFDYVQRNPLQTVELNNSRPSQAKSRGKKRELMESSAPSKRAKKESRKTLPTGFLSSIGAKLHEIASRSLSGVFDGKMPDPTPAGSRESEPSRRKSWFEV